MADHCDGYTNLELLVTLAILSLATAAGLSLFMINTSEKPPMVLAQQVETAFVDARIQALTHQTPSTVELRLEDRFEVLLDGKTMFSEPLGQVSVFATSGKLNGSKTSASLFVFFPNGTSSGGSITFKDQNSQIMLRLSWFSGLTNVRVSKTGSERPEDGNEPK